MRKQVVFWRSFLWFFHLWLLLGTRFSSFWVSKTYRLTGLVPPFSYPEDHFASLGTPERTMEGHMGAQNQIFSDFARFWLIWGARFESFLGSDGLNSLFFLSLFLGNCLHRFSGGIIDSWRSENKVFAWEVLQKPCFRKNRLLVIRGSIFSVFWRPWGKVF